MRIGIFYLSLKRATADCQPIELPLGGHAYVRVVEVECQDEEQALRAACPRRGESLMNTHQLVTK